MNNRRKLAALDFAGPLPLHVQALVDQAFQKLQQCWTVTKRATMALGLMSIAALSLMFFNPALLDDLKALSPFATASDANMDPRELAFADMLDLPQQPLSAEAVMNEALLHPASSKEQQRVTQWLARRYHIAGSASQMLVDAAYESGQEAKLDPLLILAVMAIESRFNPFAESAVGAQGLMQVMAKLHHEKFSDHGGPSAALNPVANIEVGARILQGMIRRSGSVESGLKLYVGAGNMETDGGYAAKVMAEYARLQAVAAGKRVPTFTPPQVNDDLANEAKAEKAPTPTRSNEAEPA